MTNFYMWPWVFLLISRQLCKQLLNWFLLWIFCCRPKANNNTLPGSVFLPPLTPPLTAERLLSKGAQNVANCFRLHCEGYRPNPWWESRLRPNDYPRVLDSLDADKTFKNTWMIRKIVTIKISVYFSSRKLPLLYIGLPTCIYNYLLVMTYHW
jgi:hypothetical protein